MPNLLDRPVLALAFRPFFLAGSLYALFVVGYWGVYLLGLAPLPPYFAPTPWHAHEMLFGFVVAILTGFILTASRNWANTRGVHGGALLFLLVLWVLGRVGILASAIVPRPLVALLDLSFLPCATVMLCLTLMKGTRKVNFVFVFWMAVLFAANLIMHFGPVRTGYLLAVDTMVVIMVIMGGRIIPMFTQNAVPGVVIVRRRPIEMLALAGAVLYLVSDLVAEQSIVTSVIAIVAGFASLARLATWRSLATAGRPVLWVLHVGYALVGLGLIARGASLSFLAVMPSVPIHLLTAGAMGVLILGMISRVALGHTGRPIVVSAPITVAYLLVIAGALVRVLLPVLLPSLYAPGMAIAAALWGLGFAIYAIQYWPVLTGPRVDGREG